MSSSDPRKLAAEVIRRVLEEDAFAAAVLSAELDRHPQMTPRDRGLATELVYGTLRTARFLEGRLGQLAPRGTGGLTNDVRAHLLVAAYQVVCLERVPAHAAVNAAVEAIKELHRQGLAAFANAVLRKLAAAREKNGPMDPLEATLAGAPRWLVRALDRALGEGEGAAFLRAGPVPPPTCLRVRRGEPAEVATRLAAALPAATVVVGSAAPCAIRVWGGGDPRWWPGVDSGDLAVQDEGSQAVVAELGALPGERVLDACAGRGNKALALADAVGPKGLVDAADLHGAKLDRLAIEARRLGITLGARYEVDWTVGRGDVPEAAYDRVLVDAPCSGVGTLRRRPEILLKRTAADIAELAGIQRAILHNAATCLRPGGTLVYAVCSVLAEELEGVLGEPPPGFTVLSTRRLLPTRDGTDGYGLAVLTRSISLT